MKFHSSVLAATHTMVSGFQYGGYGRCGSGVWTGAVGGDLGWLRQVIPWWLMNGGTDGSFVPVMELATALWEED